MAKRKLFRETPREQGIQRHQGGVSGTIAMSGQEAWVNTMMQANDHISQFLDRKAIQEGKEAGLKAAKAGEFKERGGANLYDTAHDTAGREGYKSAMSTKMSTSLADIYEENKHDPASLLDKMDKFKRSMIADAEGVSPEVAMQMDAAASRQILSYTQNSRGIAEKALTNAAAVSANMNVTAISSRAQWSMKNLDDRTLAMQSVAAERGELESFLIQNGPKEAFHDPSVKLPRGGRRYLTDASEKAASESSRDRTGVFTPKQIQLALQDFDDKTVHEQHLWGMRKAIEIGKGSDYIENFVDRPDPTLRPDQADAIEKAMWSELSQEVKLNAAETKAAKLAQELQYKETDSQLTSLAINGQLTDGMVTKALDRDALSPSDARTLHGMIKGGGPEHSDGMTLMLYSHFGLLNASEEEILKDGRLTYSDREKLLDERRKIVDDQDNWMNSPSGNDGSRRIKVALGIADGIMLPGMSQALVKRAGEAESRYIDEVNKLPIEKRQYSAIDVANKVVKEIMVEENKAEILNLREQVGALPYRTVEELDTAQEEGDVIEFSTLSGVKKSRQYTAYKRYLESKLRQIDELERKVGNQ